MNPSGSAPPQAPAVAPVHDFAAKLRQPGLRPRLEEYVAWRRALGEARSAGLPEPEAPDAAPLSINLDLTTACNYACDHCIDWDILNRGVSHDDRLLRRSLETMAGRGLRSVILIGGGEPTLHPTFVTTVRYLKALGLQVAVVSNGSRNDRLLEVADLLDGRDWLRLSLDAGTDATFQAMHRPKKPITLERICAGIPPIKERNQALRIGFSFIVTWRGAVREPDVLLVENLDEMVAATRLARDSRFNFISFKPVLTRADAGAEVLDATAPGDRLPQVLDRIRAGLEAARALETSDFAVVESTNLRLLLSGRWPDWTRQPHTCHMQAFRQVLSPLGLWNCPAHRGVEKARLGDKNSYAGDEATRATAAATARLLDGFDAAHECREVTCLYNAANWWIEAAIEDPRRLAEAPDVSGEDYFL